MPLPEIRDKPALHLPQDRFCLTNPGYTVKPKPVGGSAAQPPALYISCICVSCARSCSTNTLVASVIAHTTAFAAIKAAWTMAKRTNKGLCLCACLCVSVSLWMNSPPPHTHTHAHKQHPCPFAPAHCVHRTRWRRRERRRCSGDCGQKAARPQWTLQTTQWQMTLCLMVMTWLLMPQRNRGQQAAATAAPRLLQPVQARV